MSQVFSAVNSANIGEPIDLIQSHYWRIGDMEDVLIGQFAAPELAEEWAQKNGLKNWHLTFRGNPVVKVDGKWYCFALSK